MKGYVGNPEATHEMIEPDGWLNTGDLARMDDSGYVYLLDRLMAAVGAISDEVKGQRPKAYVVLAEGCTAVEEEILAFCAERLASYKMPKAIQCVRSLPRTRTGKVMRRRLSVLDGGKDWEEEEQFISIMTYSTVMSSPGVRRPT